MPLEKGDDYRAGYELGKAQWEAHGWADPAMYQNPFRDGSDAWRGYRQAVHDYVWPVGTTTERGQGHGSLLGPKVERAARLRQVSEGGVSLERGAGGDDDCWSGEFEEP